MQFNNTLLFLAVSEAVLTFGLVMVLRRIFAPKRRTTVTYIAGITFPVLTALVAVIFTALQPPYKSAWSDLGLNAMLGLALMALPLCVGVAFSSVYFSNRPR